MDRRRMAAFGLMMMIMYSAWGEKIPDTILSKEEATFVRSIMLRDQLLRELPKAQASVAGLNTLLKIAPTGPVKLALAWNQAAIKSWRIANKKLEEIGKASICDELQGRIEAEKSNVTFFKELYISRGCDDR